MVWIYGDAMKDFVVCFIVVNLGKVKKYSKETGKDFDEKLMKDEDLRNTIYADFVNLANTNQLNSLEKPGQICLLWDPMTEEDNLLTPTMKVKRNIATKFYDEQIKAMYKGARITMPKK